jgi:serine/threonine-protein kinase
MSLSIGQTLQGKYVVKKQLGKGGFGLTYLAEHQYLSQDCVLKVPNQELQRDPEYAKFVQKFMQEGQKLAKLAQQRHPHIVRVTDLFEERGLPCLVMDFIAGESLLDRVNRKGALSEVEVVGFILQMADALAVVHREGLVHRDCHPGNIMILPPERHQPERQAILIDFGIAGEMFPTTVSSKFFGNPAFAPYEQFGSKAAPSMDVYTLAASCYFAVTGQYPTTGLDRKLYGKNLISPIKHRSDLTPALNQAIMNGMALEAINRPSLAVWKEQLQQAVAPPPITATVRVMRPEPQGNWLENLLGLNKPTSQNIPIQPNPVPLKSAKGIDYGKLEKLLKNKQWYEADQLTDKLMLKASGREEEGWIDFDSIKNFPCEDLQTIDRLWVHYSNGLYGFSVQKQIYVECGGKLDFSYPSNETWEKFCDRTAWKKDGKYVNYPKPFFEDNFMNVKGHLPRRSVAWLVFGSTWERRGEGSNLFSHRDL